MDADTSGTLNSGDTDITLYEWDHRNRLTKVTHKATFAGSADHILAYTYDAFDRMVRRAVDADANSNYEWYDLFVYDGSDPVAQWADTNGQTSGGVVLAKRFLNGPAVDMILAEEDGSVSITAAERVLWPHADNQGTVRDLLNNDGEHVEHYVYDAFGELVAVTDDAGDPLAEASTEFLYTGLYRDPHTGFYHTITRWYDPVTGRWIHEDWIGVAGGVNLNAYVGNSPTNATDPLGLEQISIGGGLGDPGDFGGAGSGTTGFGGDGDDTCPVMPLSGPGSMVDGLDKLTPAPWAKLRRTFQDSDGATVYEYEDENGDFFYGMGPLGSIPAHQVNGWWVPIGSGPPIVPGEPSSFEIMLEGGLTVIGGPVIGRLRHLWAARLAAGGTLAQFARAAEFGIQPYGLLSRLTARTGLQAHHLIEQRFAAILGESPSAMKAIALTPAEHQAFTNAWRQAIGYIGDRNPITTANATREQILNAAREIYRDFPEILRALGL